MFGAPARDRHRGRARPATRRPNDDSADLPAGGGGDEDVADLDSLEPGSVTGWAAYPAGVAEHWPGSPVRRGRRRDRRRPARRLDLLLGRPRRCAVALALTGLYQVAVPRPELAALARRAETVSSVPSGIIDGGRAPVPWPRLAARLPQRHRHGGPARSGRASLTLLVIEHQGSARAGRRRTPGALHLGHISRWARDTLAGAPAAGAGRLADPALRHLAGRVLASAAARSCAPPTCSAREPSGDSWVSWPEAVGRRGRHKRRRRRCP